MKLKKRVFKTNAMRILEKEGVPYKVLSYDDDKEHPLHHGAAGDTARKLEVDEKAVFKTIVMRTSADEICVFCQSSDSEISLKKARIASESDAIAPVRQDELLSLTGYVRGGCSPLGMKRKYRTFIDSHAIGLKQVFISAGERGKQIVLDPRELARVCEARFVDITP